MKIQIASAILVAIVILIGYCVAQDTGSTTIDANIQGIFQLQATPKIPISLVTGSNTAVGDLTVTANGQWSVQVSSDRTDGKMREYDTTAHQYNEGAGNAAARLDNPMEVREDDAGQIVELSSTPTDFMVNHIETGTTHHIIKFATQVLGTNPGMNVDVHLQPPKIYRIVVTFTGSLQY